MRERFDALVRKTDACWLWEIDRPHRSEYHPTMKPVELFARAIRNSSTRGDLVLDPFVGSGTAIVACEETARVCCALDIDPACCAVAIQRWVDQTGEKPKRLD
jgi:DNA modification methylase